VKKSDIQRVARITLITAFCALLFFIVVMILTQKLDNKYISGEYASLTPQPTSAALELKDVSATLIFVTGEEGGLSGLYLAELDCINVKWRLTVIPLDSRLTLSVDLYKKALKENVSAPQLTTVGEFYKYFEEKTAVDMTTAAISEIITISPDYYLLMPEEVFYGMFKQKPESYSYSYFLKEDLEGTILKGGGMQRYMTSILEKCSGSLKVKDYLYYLESFENLTNLDISCRLIPGEQHNNGYEISADRKDFFTK